MSTQNNGFGTIVKNLTEGSGGVTGVNTSIGVAGAGAVGKVFRVAQDQTLLDTPSSIVEDGVGNIWVSNVGNQKSSLVKLDGTSLAATPIQLGPSNPFGADPDTVVRVSKLVYSNPYIFAASRSGAIYVINPTTNAVVGTLVGPDGVESGEVFSSVCVDGSGNVWGMLATSPTSLYKWTAPYTTTLKEPVQVLNLGSNMTGLIFSDGYLWLGSGGGGPNLHRVDPTDGTTVSRNTTLSYAWMPHAGNGLIWIASSTHVHGYNPATFPSAPSQSIAFGGNPLDGRECVWDGSSLWVLCDDIKRSILRIQGSSVISTLTYFPTNTPCSPTLIGNKIWFCNQNNDVSLDGALVRLDPTGEKFDLRYQGTTKLTLLDDTANGNWLHAIGGLQITPFISAGGRIIWQQHTKHGQAIVNDGGDRFRLHGGYDTNRQFKLTGNVGYSDGTLFYQWYDVTNSNPIGRVAGNATNVMVADAIAYVTIPAGKSIAVELRIMYSDNVTQIGDNISSNNFYPAAFLEVIGSGPIEVLE